MSPEIVFASDIDGTLTGDEAALADLVAALRPLRQRGALRLVLATGRSLEQVEHGMAFEGLPEPDAVITQVGTEIHLPPWDGAVLASWQDQLAAHYTREEAVGFFSGIAGLRLQPEACQTALKASAYVDGCDDPDAAAAEIQGRAARAAGHYRVIYSSDRDVDVLPADAGKGGALRHLLAHMGWEGARIAAAGDTGNDIALLEVADLPIAVANADTQLAAWESAALYRAEARYAAGVLQGLRAGGVLA